MANPFRHLEVSASELLEMSEKDLLVREGRVYQDLLTYER